MDGHTLSVLSYTAVRDRLAAHCLTEFGRTTLLAFEPLADRRQAEERLDLIEDIATFLEHHPLPDLVCDDLTPLLDRLKPKDALLTLPEFVRIFRTLHAIQTLRSSIPASTPPHGLLASLAASIPSLKDLLDAYHRVFDAEGRIRDDASPHLATVRRSLADLRRRIRHIAESVLRSTPAQALESHEPVLWEDRTVLLVKSSARRLVDGIVHAASASGHSLYLEPTVLLEPNNELAALLAEEETEITRILRTLADLTASDHDRILTAMRHTAEFDTACAALRWSRETDGTRPVFTDRDWDIRRARHPLIHRCVPVDIRIPPPASVLVLSGPNTAGKSATLKTAGLLSCLAMTGWPVPAASCRMPWFDRIFIDLGDEQSLETGLSTFAAHLRRIRDILAEATPSSLVLLDEPGDGTEPEAGAAIAETLLRELADRGCLVITTTHFRRLKILGQSDPRFADAAVGFDPATGLPDYTVLYGVPGDSRPLDAMRRAGFDPDFLGKVERNLQSPEQDLATAIGRLTEERRRLEAERLALEQARQETLRAAAEAEKSRKTYEERERLLRNEFRRQTKAFLDESRSRFERLVKNLVETGRTSAQSAEIRNLLREVENRIREQSPPITPSTSPPLTPGQPVLVRRKFEAVLEAVKNGKAIVRTPSGRAVLDLADCAPLPPSPSPPPSTPPPPPPTTPTDTELVLIGLRRDEAERRLRDFLDAALLAGRTFLRIVHGKGNGVLRTMTREILEERRKAGDIRSYTAAPPASGGDGCTLVEL